MGDHNTYQFGIKHLSMFKSPILEIGSKNYGNTATFREYFSDDDIYIGLDMEEGDGVDLVLDLTEDFEIIDQVLGGQRFNSIICVCVLEHCTNPFKMADHIERLLNPDGVAYISAPFSWRLHGYPDDYWRFTPAGIRTLFSHLAFEDEHCCLSTSRMNDYYPIDQIPRCEFDLSKGMKKGQYGKLTARMIQFIWDHDLLPWLVRWAYLYPPVNVNMIGMKHK